MFHRTKNQFRVGRREYFFNTALIIFNKNQLYIFIGKIMSQAHISHLRELHHSISSRHVMH